MNAYCKVAGTGSFFTAHRLTQGKVEIMEFAGRETQVPYGNDNKRS